MSKKKQFWDYIATLSVRLSAGNREEAKEIVSEEFIHHRPWPSPIRSVTITRIKPVAK